MTFDPIFTMAMTTLGSALAFGAYEVVRARAGRERDAAPVTVRRERASRDRR